MARNDKMYVNLITTLTSEITQAEKITKLSGNNKVFSVFWHIGKHILEYRKANPCGVKIVYDISKDLLKKFPTYLSLDPQNLIYMQYHDMKDIAFTFIELPKYKKGKSEKLNSRIEQWCRYFKYGDDTTEEEAEKIVDPQIKQAYEAVNRFNWTEEELAAYEAAEKRERDYRSQMQTAEAKGEARGVEKTAINMLKYGSDIKFISTVTGLSKEEILKLKSKV